MFKLPRFNNYRQPYETISEDTEPDEWQQHVRLPLSPAAYSYLKTEDEPDLVSKNAALILNRNNARLGNEHILSALGDLIRALDINGKEVIDYILANDLVRGEATDEP